MGITITSKDDLHIDSHGMVDQYRVTTITKRSFVQGRSYKLKGNDNYIKDDYGNFYGNYACIKGICEYWSKTW